MAITTKSDWTFDPQVASGYISAYFRERLIWAKLAWMPAGEKEFNEKTPGGKITFPYWGKIGAAQDKVESVAMAVDKITDNEFMAEIKAISKAVSITDAARKYSGATREELESEVHRQIGRVMAEKVDKDVLAELSLATSSDSVENNNGDVTITSTFDPATRGIDDVKVRPMRCNIRNITKVLTEGFGDRRNEAKVIILHPKHYNDIETDQGAGFLKADANDPLYKLPGFVGRSNLFLGLAFFINEGVPLGNKITVTDSAGTTQKFQEYKSFILKADPLGFWPKQKPLLEYARDILKSDDYVACTQWYAVKSFHKKISSQDVRVLNVDWLTDTRTA